MDDAKTIEEYGLKPYEGLRLVNTVFETISSYPYVLARCMWHAACAESVTA
jgi:hypothetical protein